MVSKAAPSSKELQTDEETEISNHNNKCFNRKKLEVTSKGSPLNWGKRWRCSKQRKQYAQNKEAKEQMVTMGTRRAIWWN